MSLGRLLTSGRSLIGLKDLENRYQMREKARLPKFGSSRNPFLARTGSPVAASPAQADASSFGLTPAERASANLKRTRRLPVISAAGGTAGNPGPGWLAMLSVWMGGWVRSLTPRAWRRQVQAVPRPAAMVSSMPSPVQGELSLDRVKVVRNDLSEADVEVVPAKMAAGVKPGSAETAKETGELVSVETR